MESVRRSCSRLETGYKFLFENIAKELKLKIQDLNCITGSLYCIQGSPDSVSESESKYGEGNIGLKLKFHNKEIVGYSHWNGGECFLSQDAKDLIYKYKKRFPTVFKYFATKHKQQKCYFETDLFPDVIPTYGGLQACLDWLESLPTWNKYINPVPYGAISLNQSQISEVQSAVMEERVKPEQCKDIQIDPSNLFMPTDHQGGLIPDLKASYEVLDRVVNVSRSCPVPLGLRGTVIGASIPSDKSDDHAMIEILFDQEFSTGVSIRGSKRNCYCLPMCCLINLSHGRILVERLHRTRLKI